MWKWSLPRLLEWRVVAPTVFMNSLDRQPIGILTVGKSRDVASNRCVQISGGQRAGGRQSARSNEQLLSQSPSSTTGKQWRLIYGESTLHSTSFDRGANTEQTKSPRDTLRSKRLVPFETTSTLIHWQYCDWGMYKHWCEYDNVVTL